MNTRQKLAGLALAGAMSTAIGVTVQGTAHAAEPPDLNRVGQYFEMINQNSGKCADVTGKSRNPHALVQQYSCHQGDNQLWALPHISDGYRQLVNRNSGLCMDIQTNDVVENGTPIQQFTCDAGYPSEQWLLVPVDPPSGSYKVVTRAGGKCLQVKGGSKKDRAPLEMWDCFDTPAQNWRFR